MGRLGAPSTCIESVLGAQEPVGFWDPQELSEGCGLLKFLHLRFEALHQLVTARRCRGAVQRRCRRTCSWGRKLRWPRRWPQPRACMPRQWPPPPVHSSYRRPRPPTVRPLPVERASAPPRRWPERRGPRGTEAWLLVVRRLVCLHARCQADLKTWPALRRRRTSRGWGNLYKNPTVGRGGPRTPRGAVGSPGPWSGCQSCPSPCRL